MLETINRVLHLSLVEELAEEFEIDPDWLISLCDELGIQTIECDWEDQWPTRTPKLVHGRKNNKLAERLDLESKFTHETCKDLGIMFIQAGDKRAGSAAFFR